jgi:hypothetical protein
MFSMTLHKMLIVFISFLSLLTFSSCLLESKIQVNRVAQKKSSAIGIEPEVISTSMDLSSRQITLNGSNLDSITSVRIVGPASFNKTFDIDNKSFNQLLISAQENLNMLADEVYNIILSSASGDTTFQTSFTLSDMGAANGEFLQYDGTNWVAVPLPLSGVQFQGTWDANTNQTNGALTLVSDGSALGASPGDYFIVATAGSSNVGCCSAWSVGDWIIFNGTQWDRVNNDAGVTSFNGRTGAVSPSVGDYDWSDLANNAGAYIDYLPNNIACVDGEVLKYDSGTPGWICATDNNTAGTGDITDVIAGTGLTGGATTGAATLNVDVGTGANQIVQLDGSGNFPAIDGAAITNLDPTNLSAPVAISLGGTGATTATGAQTALGLGTSAVADIGTAAGEVMGADGVPNCLSTEKLQMSAGPTFTWSCVADNDTAGSTTFVALTDTPTNFVGAADQFVKVNAGANALEFVSLLDTDTSLGNSDTVAPTQNAVKTYVDAQVGAFSSDTLIDADSNTQIQVEEGANDDTIRFDTAGAERLVISSTGNIGIGTDTPDALLTLSQLADNSGIKINGFDDRASRSGEIAISPNGYLEINTTVNLDLMTAGSTRMRLNNVGDVGIGTTSPAAKLDVRGNIRTMDQGEIRFSDTDNTNYVAFKAPTVVATNITWTLPAVDGSSGQVLSTDGSGALSWASAGAGGTTAVADGGTGATTAADARTNLGLEIDANVQAFDAQLVDIAGLTPTADNFIVGDGSNFVLANAAATRTSLGVDIGSDVQGFNDRLADIAGMTATLNNIIIGNGSNFVIATPSGARSALGLALGTNIQSYSDRLTDISAVGVTANNFIVGDGSNLVLKTPADARTSLGLGSIATQGVDSLNLTGTAGEAILTLTDSDNTDSINIMTGSGTPEAAVTAQLGSLYSDHASGKLYKKGSGDGTNTGWDEMSVAGAGGGGPTISLQTGNFSATGADNNKLFVVSNTVGTSATLPSAATVGANFILNYKNVSINGILNPLTFVLSGSETIDGLETVSLNSTNATMSLISDGTNWLILNQSGDIGIAHLTINISSNQTNYNLRTDLINNHSWDGTSVVNVQVTVDSGVIIDSSDEAQASFDTGLFPTGSLIQLVNKGRILGAGGDGHVPFFGGGSPGGDAINLQAHMTIDTSSGDIFGGGGGGLTGGSGFAVFGGSGGQGSVGGLGGVGGSGNGLPGSISAPGASAGGGAGGAFGEAGGPSETGTASGRSIHLNGFSVRIDAGDNATHVLGRRE